jgi:hypothetical protein
LYDPGRKRSGTRHAAMATTSAMSAQSRISSLNLQNAFT